MKILAFLLLTACAAFAQTGLYTLSSGTDSQTGTFAATLADQSSVWVYGGGNLTLTNATLTKSGDASSTAGNYQASSQYGINAGMLVGTYNGSTGSAGTVTLSGTTVNTSAAGANGIYATYTGSSISMTGGSITTTTTFSHGADVTYGGSITLNGTTITTSGSSGSAGLSTDFGGGTVTATNVNVTTAGSGSPAIYSTGTISATSSTLRANGGYGAIIDGGNVINLTTSSLTAATSGVRVFRSSSGSTAATVTVNGGSITANNGDVFFADGSSNGAAIGTFTIKGGATVSTSTGILMHATVGAATTHTTNAATFIADGETLAGNIVTDAYSTITTTLQNSTTLTGFINNAAVGTDNLTVDSTSAWSVSSASTLNALTNAGTISGAGAVTAATMTLQSGTISAVLAGSGALTKTTTGTATLSGTNTYSGTTSVSAGTLNLAGSLANSAVTVSSGATLGGTGAVSSLAVNSGATLVLNSSGHISVSGNLSFGGSVTVSPASGGVAAGTYTLLSYGGTLSGTPAFTYTGSGQTATFSTATSGLVTVTISAIAPSITTSSPLTSGAVGAAYSQTLAATGGSGTGYTFAVTSGTLPAGLSLSSAGALSGTPTAAGASSFTVTVTDSALATGSKTFSLTVNAALSITTSSLLANGATGTAYSQTIAASGGTGSYTWALTSGSLPAGITFSTAGVLSGTPTATGTFNFTLQVTDTASTTASKTFALTITGPLAIGSTSPLSGGTTGAAYSVTLSASGGTTPYAWSVASGTVPTGLSLSSAGVLSGTPTATGTFNFTAQVADSASATVTKAFAVTIVAPLSISTASPLTGGTVNAAYSVTLAATGGSGTYSSWSVTSGTLPTGLSLSTTGVLSGTPTVAGTFSFTIQVTDSASSTASKAFTATIASAPLSISTTSPLNSGTIGTAFSQTLAAMGGTGTGYAWSVTSGTLPAGLGLSSAGVLSGTPTTAASSTFTVQVADSASTTATKPLTITINASFYITTATPLTGGTRGSAYSQTFAATGGSGTYTLWSISGGTLPAGMGFSTAGVLSGVPTAAGTSSFTITVKDSLNAMASKAFTLTVVNPTLTITSTSPLAAGYTTSAYSQTLAATGGTGTGYAWSVTSGTLPAGLSLSSAGVLSGTPTAAGTFSFTIQVTDSASNTATKAFTLTTSTPSALAISTAATLTGGNVSAAYSVTLAATGGTGTYTWALTSGTLPNGFTLSSAGVISGTSLGPPSTSSPVITVTDSAAATAVRTFSITISPGTSAIITTSPLTSGQLGTAYSLTFVGAGPPPAYTWTLDSGSLPTGLALSTAGVLSGTPTALGSYSFTIRFTATNSTTVAKAFTMSVVNPLTISSTSPLTSGTAGTAYSQTLAATGGTSVYTWSVSAGTLPTGLAFTSAGVLSGTPTAAGTFNFTAQVADTGGLSTTKAFAVTIVNPLTITSTSPLVGGTTGTAYSQTLAASGGVTAYTWSTASGTVPTGLSLSSAGVLSGTPAVAGSFTFTAQVTDSASFSTAATFVVTVVDPLSITTTSPLAGGVTGTAYSQTFTATGGTSPYTWNLSAGTVPTGLTLSTAGVLSGTPTATGTFSFTVRAADSGGLTATKAFAATVIDPLAAFLAAYGLSSASDDSDGDGISNLMEFLLGGNPTAPNTGILPTASKTTVNGNPALVFSFYVTTAPGAVTWAVEYSSDLSTWTTAVHGENGITITSASAGAGLNLITVTIPTTESKCVARLRVTPP